VGRARARVIWLAVVVAFTTSACFGGGGGSTTPTSTTSPASRGPGCQFIVASEAKRETIPIINQSVFLDNAGAVPTVCYDEITFTFAPGADGDLPPAYTVQYVPLNAPGVVNSATASLTGVKAVLEVVMHPAAESNAGSLTYKGNLRLALQPMNHTLIVEYLSSLPQPSPDPNQSQVVWLIGLDQKRPFTTDAANGPPRVSVLVMN
jgi:hypothetical protein